MSENKSVVAIVEDDAIEFMKTKSDVEFNISDPATILEVCVHMKFLSDEFDRFGLHDLRQQVDARIYHLKEKYFQALFAQKLGTVSVDLTSNILSNIVKKVLS